MIDMENINAVREDLERKTFAVQSLIGQRERLLELLTLIARTVKGNDVAPVLRAVRETRSQFLQEVFALAMAGGKRKGFFVEFGACDGLHLSNTYLLETKFRWRGILSEPARAWHDALLKNRTAKIEQRCVAPDSGKELVFHEAKDPGKSGNIENKDVDVSKSYNVETISLIDLLRRHGAPRHIDFLSVDTEGTELEILKAFDFSKHRFGFISVEQHQRKDGEAITSLMNDAGYEPLFLRKPNLSVWSQVSGFDVWYVPKVG